MKKRILIPIIAVVVTLAITVTFVSASTSAFKDVEKGSWYEKAVEYCYANGYIIGTSDTTFSPNMNLTRGMTVTILAAMSHYDRTQYTDRQTFSDVKKGEWYSPAVEWAYENHIVSGYNNGKFGPNDAINREQFAVILKAYAVFNSYESDVTVEDIDGRFPDSAKVSSWAKDSVSWAVSNGLISGTNKGLEPQGTATRAQAAVMLYKFIMVFVEKVDSFAGDFTVSRAFGDHMTIQRDKSFSVWGWADQAENGSSVKVEFKGETAYGKVENGEWKATFDATFPASAEPAVIKVSGNSKTVEFDDVLVGDVYYVMGQSNVYWSMGLLEKDLAANHRLKDIEDITYDDSTNIRLFRNSHVFQAGKTGEDAWGTSKVYKDVDSEYAVWSKPSDFDPSVEYTELSEFVGGRAFSAIGYMFAFNLSKQTDVPIAMIEIDASGYPLTAFAPNELADKWGSDAENTETGVHYMFVNGVVYPLHSRMAYNQQLYPLINFSCAGILWYQGESDMINTILACGKDKWTFSTEIADLMKYYRTHFGDGKDNFPVYFVEFPACFQNKENAYLETGYVRSELGTVPMYLENSYVVSSSDVWNNRTWANNIHPYCKPAQARRAANMALANEYGIGDINYVAGPQLDKVEYTDDKTALLTFKYVGDGITALSEDETGDLYGFEVLTTSSSYSGWEVTYDVTIVSSNQLQVKYNKPIYGVRYNAKTDAFFPANVNLCNSAWVPAVAFANYKN